MDLDRVDGFQPSEMKRSETRLFLEAFKIVT